jgi:Ca2+-binding EF-hand superfamily protein
MFSGLGIDMSDEELRAVAEELNITDGYLYFDHFVQFMVSRTQIRDTFEEVLSSFITLSGGKVSCLVGGLCRVVAEAHFINEQDFMSDDLVKNMFQGHTQEYILENMPKTTNGRDYSTFASSLFER